MAKPQTRPEYTHLTELLAELRAKAGLTQRELAEELGVPQNTIYRMERGIRRCDTLEFIAWCRACEADPVRAYRRLL
ncbi:MAG: helix-turn-helix transcriptional regulator [Planctomycetota bacterium]